MISLFYGIFVFLLIFHGGALAGKSWALSNDATWIRVDDETYGAQADQRGPIGGGRGYTDIVTTGDMIVEGKRTGSHLKY